MIPGDRPRSDLKALLEADMEAYNEHHAESESIEEINRLLTLFPPQGNSK